MLELTGDIYSRSIDQILRYVDDEKVDNRIPQPMFIIGSRGAGKSTYINQLIARLKEDGWTDRLHVFDGKQFFNSDDIILAIERSDSDNHNLHKPQNDISRRIVIIDDLDYFFNRSSLDDQYILRNYLNNEKAPLLIATLSEVSESLTDYRAPFFEGVRTIYLPTINSVLESIGDTNEDTGRLLALLEYMPPVIRSIKIASEIIALSDDPKNDLKELISRVAPHYRAKLENMPVYTQKILYALAKYNKPATLSDIRGLTGLPSSTLSTYLRQLTLSGELKKDTPEKRGASYELKDKLFNLWLSQT